MKIKSVTMSGFMSWCRETTINFDEFDHFTVITGKSGAGKSSIFDAITYCLYGKPLRPISKGQLVNLHNKKNSFVRVVVENHLGSIATITRKVAGSGLSVEVDGEEIDPGHDTLARQEFIEKFIGLTYQQFTMVVALANVRSYSFASLSVSERRKFVDDVFGLERVEDIRKKIVRKLNTIKSDVASLRGRLDAIQFYIDSVSIEGGGHDADRYKKAIEKRGSIAASLKKVESARSKLKSLLFELNSSINSLVSRKRSLLREAESVKLETVCDKCGQPIDENHKKRIIEGLKAELSLVEEEIKGLVSKKSSVEGKLGEIENKLRVIRGKVSEVDKIIAEEESKAEVDKVKRSGIDKLKSDLNKVSVEIRNKEFLLECYEIAADIMSDDGIKRNYYISVYSLLSDMVTRILMNFGLNTLVKIDETGLPTFIRNGEDVKYYSFSDGERARIDLAFALAWSEIVSDLAGVKIRTMLLDEVTINLDAETVTLVKNFFYSLVNDRNMKVVMVSHNDTIIESVPFQIIVEKTNGCSWLQHVR